MFSWTSKLFGGLVNFFILLVPLSSKINAEVLPLLRVAVFDMTANGLGSNGTWKSMNSIEVQYI